MKKFLSMVAPLIIGLLLTSTVLAGASSVTFQETSLQPGGLANEINLGMDGLLYVSDYTASQIWRVDPVNPQVDKYQLGMNVSDARPDGSGNIWFTDGATTFARLNPNTVPPTAVYWDVPESHNLYGLTFDSSGKLWMTEWFSSLSKIYSFDMTTTELCTYTLPLNGERNDGSLSFYILSKQGNLWIANRGEQRIYRLNPSTDLATWWQIPYTDSRPVGIAFDSLGNLWWADEALGNLGRLDPTTNNMTSYALPNAAQPKMIMVQSDSVWYTAVAGGGLGYIGVLHPQQLAGTPIELNSQTYPASKICNPNWGPGSSLYVSHTTPTQSWSDNTLTININNNAWQVFQLPSGASPYGINFANGKIWATDQSRYKLMRIPINDLSSNHIFLPIIVR